MTLGKTKIDGYLNTIVFFSKKDIFPIYNVVYTNKAFCMIHLTKSECLVSCLINPFQKRHIFLHEVVNVKFYHWIFAFQSFSTIKDFRKKNIYCLGVMRKPLFLVTLQTI